MINELNKNISTEDIKLNPFNERGFSVNQFVNDVFFLFCDERHQVLRLYINVTKLDSYYRSQVQVLTTLLEFNGPQSNYADLKVGFDLNSDYLWISSALPLEQCSNGQQFKAQVNNFRLKAAALKEQVLAKLNEAIAAAAANAAIAGATAKHAPQIKQTKVLASQTSSNMANDYQANSNTAATTTSNAQSEQLVQLMTSTQMYWG